MAPLNRLPTASRTVPVSGIVPVGIKTSMGYSIGNRDELADTGSQFRSGGDVGRLIVDVLLEDLRIGKNEYLESDMAGIDPIHAAWRNRINADDDGDVTGIGGRDERWSLTSKNKLDRTGICIRRLRCPRTADNELNASDIGIADTRLCRDSRGEHDRSDIEEVRSQLKDRIDTRPD